MDADAHSQKKGEIMYSVLYSFIFSDLTLPYIIRPLNTFSRFLRILLEMFLRKTFSWAEKFL